MKLSAALARLAKRPSAPPPDVPLAPPPARLALPPPDEDEEAGPWNPRHMSPRQFADMAHELYLEGVLGWPEYRMVGFPSELHPDFDTTIGALIGRKAEPDRPRDMLAEWEARVDFERRYNRDDREVRRAERVLEVLRAGGRPRPRFGRG